MNPETKKAKSVPMGLGKWCCSGCHKRCTVTVSKHKAVEAAPVQGNGVA